MQEWAKSFEEQLGQYSMGLEEVEEVGEVEEAEEAGEMTDSGRSGWVMTKEDYTGSKRRKQRQ